MRPSLATQDVCAQAMALYEVRAVMQQLLSRKPCRTRHKQDTSLFWCSSLIPQNTAKIIRAPCHASTLNMQSFWHHSASQCIEQDLLVWQVFKHYMKIDSSDYGEGATLVRTTSRKRPLRTDSMQEGAVQGTAGLSTANGLESRATDAGTPLLPEGVSPGVNRFSSSMASSV